MAGQLDTNTSQSLSLVNLGSLQEGPNDLKVWQNELQPG